MAALLGLLSALSIGSSDVFGRRVLATVHPMTVAGAVQLPALVFGIVTVLVIDSSFDLRDIVLGGFSGFGMGAGISFYYGGVSRASAAVVAPTVGTLSAMIPFVYAAVAQEPPSLLAATGAAVAFAGLALIAVGDSVRHRVREGLVWGTASGCGYGVGLSALIETTEESGGWPIVSQRLVAFTALLALAGVGGWSRRLARTHWPAIAVAGGLFGVATITYLVGVQIDAGPAVVTSAMFPAVSVAVGLARFGDAVTSRQLIGLVVVLVGVAGVVGG